MKIIITESQLSKLVLLQEQTSADNCNKSKGNTNNIEKWRSLDDTTRNNKISEIRSEIIALVERCKKEYIEWFSNPKTIAKFKTDREKLVVKQIPTFLNGIKNIKLGWTGPQGKDGVRAWVGPKELDTINYNLAEVHNGENFTGSIYETTKHEMGHLIDYFFKKNGVQTYYETVKINNQQEYYDNYIINDGDQYTRLNVLRGTIGAGPDDSAQVLLTKFLNKVKDGTITSDKFNFSGISTTSANPSKNDGPTSTKIGKILDKNIIVNGQNSLNLVQLFSTFAIQKGDVIYVSFDMISELNVTSKALEKKYYYLKISPK